MIQMEYKCTKIREENDFELAQSHAKRKRQFCQNFSSSVLNAWMELYNYLKPGKAPDGTVAIEIEIWNDDLQLLKKDADTF